MGGRRRGQKPRRGRENRSVANGKSSALRSRLVNKAVMLRSERTGVCDRPALSADDSGALISSLFRGEEQRANTQSVAPRSTPAKFPLFQTCELRVWSALWQGQNAWVRLSSLRLRPGHVDASRGTKGTQAQARLPPFAFILFRRTRVGQLDPRLTVTDCDSPTGRSSRAGDGGAGRTRHRPSGASKWPYDGIL